MWHDYLDEVLQAVAATENRQACRAELTAHLDALYAAARADGLDPEAARQAAMASFGPAPDLARAWRHSVHAPPFWPVPVWVVGVLLVFVPLTSTPRWTGPAGGPSGWLAIWSLVWAVGHWRSFSSCRYAGYLEAGLMPTHRAVAAAFRRAWAFLVYGGAVGWLTLRLYPAYHTGSGPLWPLFAVGLVGLFACVRMAGRSAYPFGAGVAAVAAWLIMVLGWTRHPGWLPPLSVPPATPLGLATLLAALLFTLQGVIVGVVGHAQPLSPPSAGDPQHPAPLA